MTQRPLLVFSCCWIVGSGAACMYSGLELIGILIGMALLLIVLLTWREGRTIYVCVMVFGLFLSSAYWEWNDARNVSSLDFMSEKAKASEEGILAVTEGVLVSPVQVDGDRADFELLIQRVHPYTEKFKEKVQVQVKLLTLEERKRALFWKRGDIMKITGQLERPSAARNFGGFDYRQFLRTQEIHWIYKVKGIENVEAAQPQEWKWSQLLRFNDEAREYVGGLVDQVFGGVNAGYMKGLIIGEKEDLDPDTFAEFSRLGLTHILAISGMHVAVYVGSLLFIFSRFRLTRETSLTAVIVLIPVYVLLTGASPSVVRAGVMGMIGLYAARRGLLKDGMHILSATALIMLLWNPYFLVNVSFQLSFLVTAGLMVFVPKLMPFLSFMPRWLGGTVGVSLAAQLVSFPLTIYYFNQFSLVSLFANLLLVPLISLVVLPLGMIAVLTSSLWLTGGRWMAVPIEWLNTLTFSIVEWMNGSMSFLTIWPSPKLWWIIGYFILLFMLLDRLSKRKRARLETEKNMDDTVPLSQGNIPSKTAVLQHRNRNGFIKTEPYLSKQFRSFGLYRLADLWERLGGYVTTASLAGLFILLLISGYHGPVKQGTGLVQFIDVGQGDSILVSTPEGKHILIDAGGTTNFRKEKDAWKERSSPFEVGEKVVVPLLKKRGVHSLDMVVISHNHQDHSGGLQAVLEEIPVKSIVFNGTWVESKFFEQLMNTAVNQKIPVYHADSSSIYRPDPYTEFQFLNTGKRAEVPIKLPVVENQNHESLVFELRMNEARFLFTGDADEKTEQQILNEHAERISEDLKSIRPLDVLKVGHHGSKTSTSEEWLEVWKPKAAVISAGVNNIYRHPHPDVVNRLRRYGTFAFRTDIKGEIQMKISRKGVIDVRTKLEPDDGFQ